MQCTHQECQTTMGCTHRGPLGQMCYFPPQFYSCIDHERRIAELEAVLADAYGFVASGAATEQAKHYFCRKIAMTLGWENVEAEAARKIADLQKYMST